MGKKKDRRGANAKGSHVEDEPKGPGKWMLRPEVQDSRYNRHAIYQRAVQTPKGEISYMLKFFMTYVGGRVPLHLREDFCGTALISMEWVKGDPRRTALGLDLDREALEWSLAHNLCHLPGSARDRLALLHGNVLHDPCRAVEVRSAVAAPTPAMAQLALSGPGFSSPMEPPTPQTREPPTPEGAADAPALVAPVTASSPGGASGGGEGAGTLAGRSRAEGGAATREDAQGRGQGQGGAEDEEEEGGEEGHGDGDGNGEGTSRVERGDGARHPTAKWAADIICAFNFSTFCLQSRAELLAYFRLARGSLNPMGGIFVMDMYGGTGAQQPLKIKKDYGDFLYTWQQDGFDAITQITRIHLHFKIKATNQTLKSAFTYSWRMLSPDGKARAAS